MSSTVRQAALVSIAFWVIAALIAVAAAAIGSESFGDYLTFVALILLGIVLLVGSPIANRVTAFEAKVWAGGSYRGEVRPQGAGGLTPLGLLLLLAPQIAIASLLL